MSKEITLKIYEEVMKIPLGKVSTYSQIAELCGNKKLARVVGNVLHKNPKPGVIPCHRVLNVKGELAKHFAFGEIEGQKKLLNEEGIEVIEDRVDLKKYQMK